MFSNTPEIGKPAPNFILYDQDDQIHKLDDYKSKKLVIYFFPKAETPG
ncbi:MAG: redoxin domain-containing protein [Candidatus Marinimicrobia bacterium]|nr:redoxin domain-containing protein [Candidatus Neomarinimicrobiota bacterium]